jgi:hypothetical protein
MMVLLLLLLLEQPMSISLSQEKVLSMLLIARSEIMYITCFVAVYTKARSDNFLHNFPVHFVLP